ncbi:hypothetical protein GCM10023156_59380 [Novipirellula rosea]|uniref:Uncharacterized protein n=2 Tax=Novipirellula rosea TaxID=1031540 RepID=A0ABP8NKF1_9BACT
MTMDRFIPNFDDSDEPEYQRIGSDPSWRKIYDFVSNGFWHVTSPTSWDAIRSSGAIEPNVGGRFPKRFGDISDRSYGYLKKYVSIFDFATPTERQVMRQWGNSWDVLVAQDSDQILLQLDRESLSPDIIPNSANFNEAVGQIEGGCIPWVEVWFPHKIPVASIKGVFRIPATDRYEFKPVPEPTDG